MPEEEKELTELEDDEIRIYIQHDEDHCQIMLTVMGACPVTEEDYLDTLQGFIDDARKDIKRLFSEEKGLEKRQDLH